jgi:hypothetical protein
VKGRHIRWRGGFTTVDSTALTTFHEGVLALGLTTVGAAVYRTFNADGVKAVGLYKEGHIILHAKGDIVTIEATLFGSFDWTALKQLARTAFGLKAVLRDDRTDYLVTTDDEIEI